MKIGYRCPEISWCFFHKRNGFPFRIFIMFLIVCLNLNGLNQPSNSSNIKSTMIPTGLGIKSFHFHFLPETTILDVFSSRLNSTNHLHHPHIFCLPKSLGIYQILQILMYQNILDIIDIYLQRYLQYLKRCLSTIHYQKVNQLILNIQRAQRMVPNILSLLNCLEVCDI